MNNHFERLVDASEAGQQIYHATSYWKSYEKRVLKGVYDIDFSNFRSGKYPGFEHFGFFEKKHNDIKTLKDKFKVFASAVKSIFFKSKTIIPYDLDIRDIQLMAYHHAELLAKLTNTPHPSNYSISTFGNPEDQFKVGQNHYNILSLSYFIRLCFVNQFMQFKGDEVIVELGSGSCHQIEVLKKLYPNITILCFDLPGPLYLGERFLTEALGEDKIVSSKECMNWNDLSKVEKGKVHFFGNWQSDLITSYTYDLFWNAASFGEMEPHVVKHYLSLFSQGAKAVYLLQATNGKEKGRVKDPINFSDYNNWLPGFDQQAIETVYQIHKPMTASGGYSQAIWKKKK